MKTGTAILHKKRGLRDRFEVMDFIILVILVIWAIAIIIPFISVIAISFACLLYTSTSVWWKSLT